MTTTKNTQTAGLVSIDEQGITKVLNSHFSDLLSLGPSTQKNVYRIEHDYKMSDFSFDYFNELNIIVRTCPYIIKKKKAAI